MPQRQVPKIRRITVALDASKHSLAGLEAAVDLAKRLNAELAGLFVEDINLLRLSGLPITNQVGAYSLRRQRLGKDEIWRQMKAQSRWASEALELLSSQQGLNWSFEVVRGSILSNLIEAAEAADLIILGKTGWSDTRMAGSTTRALLRQSGNLTLILREGVKLGNSLMILYDGTGASHEALEIATELADAENGRLVIMLVAEDREAADAMEAELKRWNEDVGYELVFLWTPDTHPMIVCSVARTEESGLLVVPQEYSLFTEEELMKVLNDINGPVLFVGRRG